MSNAKRIFLLLGGSPVNGVAVVAGSYVELQKKVDAVFMTMQSATKVTIRHPILSEDSAVRKAGSDLLVSLPQKKEYLVGLVSTLQTDDSSTMRGPMGLQQVLDTHTSQAPVPLICFADGFVGTNATHTTSKPVENRQQTPPPQRHRVPTSPQRFDSPPAHRRVPSVASPPQHQTSIEPVDRQSFKRVASRVRSPSKPLSSDRMVVADVSHAHPSPIRSMTDAIDRVRSPSSKAPPQRRPEAATVVVAPPTSDFEDPEELALRKRYKDLLEGMDRRKQEAQRKERQYPPIITASSQISSGRTGVVSAHTFDSLSGLRLHLITTTDTSVSKHYPELRISCTNYGSIETDDDFQRVRDSRETLDFTWCGTGSPEVIAGDRTDIIHDAADETATVKLVNASTNSISHIRLVISPLPTVDDLRKLVKHHVPGFGKYDTMSTPDLYFCTPARRKAIHDDVQKRPVRTDHDVAALCQLCFMPGTYLRAECY